MSIPRPEYPRPQFARTDWMCLNGEWQFEVDPGDSGLERGMKDRALARRIAVPFCPESELSGIGETGFMEAVWYRREVAIPEAWKGREVLLHFQAVDYDATVWVNGQEVARHRGGFTPFSCDLGGIAAPGTKATIVVRARDPRHTRIPKGKQSSRHGNYGCCYTRTTGIWQSVWLEPVPAARMQRPRITPDLAQGSFRVEVPVQGAGRGWQVRASLKDEHGEVVAASAPCGADFAPRVDLRIPEARRRPWSPQDPHLYGLSLELLDPAGRTADRAESYAGLRGLSLDGHAVLLNGRPLFQRLVLDQGYYPDGIMTAPSDAALKRDIELSLAAGFNGARLHQKVFEERFLYWADKLGYLVWGEFGDWTGAQDQPRHPRNDLNETWITQWLEVLHRDYAHPCIVGWCALNESHQGAAEHLTALDDVTRGTFLAAKAMDASRPVLDVSGYTHRVPESDIYDCHDYEQDPQKLRANQAPLAAGRPFQNGRDGKFVQTPYRGQPFFVSEFGGIWWNPDAGEGEDSWGYGQRPKSFEEFHARFEGLCAVLLDDPRMFGYCYTQLTDVYQEQNGIYRFDRTTKLDMDRIRAAQQRPAAIEL